MDRTGFGRDTTAAQVIAGIDLRGKRALVTGASGGLGAETARALASAGAAVTLAARDLEKARAAAEAIRASTGSREVEVGALPLELSRPASVRAFAKSWLAEHGALNLLVNNAGVMACPLARTPEGWELQFATNHLGHFLLTALLAPALRAGAPARIVCVSSAGHRFSPLRFDDPHFEKTPYDKWEAYGQSKTANVLHALELERRLGPLGVHALALHPGAIVTELGRHLDSEDIAVLRARSSGGGMRFKPVPAGAATSVWAASAPELEGRGGLYLEDCHVAGPRESEESLFGYAPWALDAAAARRLWRLSEELLGEAFDL